MSRKPDTPQYYMPYESGEDTDGETSIGTDDTDETFGEDIRIRREEDPRYAIVKAAGPNFSTTSLQNKYMEHAPGAIYDSNTNVSSLANYVYLNPPKTVQTTLFCMKSSNRDTNVFPSPFNFQIKLPRVFKNVTKFQLVQLSFPYNTQDISNQTSLSSTFYNYISSLGYSPSCISGCLNAFTVSGSQYNSMSILEQNRVNENGNQIVTKLEIPGGRYTNHSLAAELTSQANNTPPFNIISYDEFKSMFKVTRDIFLLFNEPGDCFYSNVTSKRYRNHSKADIMNTYYSQHDIDKHPIITDTIAFNAYYYPILKELLVTELGIHFITNDAVNISKDQIKNYVLNTFLGLDSELYYKICSANREILDQFRRNLTFQNRNINKYQWSFDDTAKKFSCRHETLHTSLCNDINKSLDRIFNDELQLHSLNRQSFTNIKNVNIQNNTILDHLQSYLSSVMGNYFINEGQYSYSGGEYYSTTALDGGERESGQVTRSIGDLHADSDFTNMFNVTSTFGRQYGNYAGKILSFTNFMEYHSTLSSYYMTVTSTTNFISGIHGNIYGRHNEYVSTKYTGILPSDMIQNKSYVTGQAAPAAFLNNRLLNIPGDTLYSTTEEDKCISTCKQLIFEELNRYYSCLPVNTVISGLNYRLGLHSNNVISFNNLITFFETVSTSNFDFYMQINPELSFNNMDVAMKENYSITNETTGQAKLMYAKILTAGLGADETSQTCIQNPILFQNTLGKLDKLTFRIFLDDEALTPMWKFYPFTLQSNEWSATFQIDEEIGFASRDSDWRPEPTIPIPTNPAALQYMGIVPRSNPLNK